MSIELPSSSPEGTLGPVPTGLEELFDKDPLNLTVLEVNSIIGHLREGRLLFKQAEIETKAAGKSRVKVPKQAGKIDLSKLLDEMP